MTAKIIDGKKIASDIIADISKEVTARIKKNLAQPHLAVVLVGDDHASSIYVKHKQKACKDAGVLSTLHQLPVSTSEKVLLSLINDLNNDKSVNGILVQLPLPKDVSSEKVLESIDPHKDVDGFHPFNLGKLVQKNPGLRPCTPHGVIQLIRAIGLDPKGLHAVVVGASNIVGRPMAFELLLASATVTICHRKTQNLAEHVKQADILVSAVGNPGLIKGDWIKSGAAVFDIGISRLDNGKLCGDIEFNEASKRANWITPVPGGVGPMTVATLMQNTLLATQLQEL
jgi:methylenetetrahydrofolate dehydrogenase (NADP+) / methenyltetrahydrofolate cyclohydrolase